jgi:hypothetical protein
MVRFLVSPAIQYVTLNLLRLALGCCKGAAKGVEP